MPPTISLARDAFITRMNRDTAHVERPRLVAVLDALIAWSASRSDVQFRADDNSKGVIRFECVDSHALIWSATPRQNDVPLLELLPGSSRVLSPEERETVMATLGSHTTRAQDPSGRLHIGFGALKNESARNAVMDLMNELVDKAGAEKAGKGRAKHVA
jgi:hypothetical protein